MAAPYSLIPFIITFSFLAFLPLSLSSTVSISEYSNQTVICALIHPQNQKSFLNCTRFEFPTAATGSNGGGSQIPLNKNASSSITAIVAGDGFLFALTPLPSSSSNTYSSLSSWRLSGNLTYMYHKRIYRGPPLKQLVAGNSHVCGLIGNGTSASSLLQCWQWPWFNNSTISGVNYGFSSIAVGENFVCGVSQIGTVTCLGSNYLVVGKEPRPSNGGYVYRAVSAGIGHACAISSVDSSLDCWGDLKGEKPQGRFTSLALGENRSCALRPNGTVVCWGENNFSMPDTLKDAYFTAIEAKRVVFCGVSSSNFSLYCWGNPIFDVSNNFMVFGSDVKPGSCTTECPHGSNPLPGSGRFCEQGYEVCQPCQQDDGTLPGAGPVPVPLPSQPSESGSSKWSRKMVAFLVVGCVGSLALVVSVCFLVFTKKERDTESPYYKNLKKLLEDLFALGDGESHHIHCYSADDLIRATNNFSSSRIVKQGQFYDMFRGFLDGRSIVVSNIQNWSNEDRDRSCVIRDIVISLQMSNHENFLKLLGCCLEFPIPVLVHEYAAKGVLNSDGSLGGASEDPIILPWNIRLRIAKQVASAVSHLHTAFAGAVIHRYLNPSCLFLDDDYVPKLYHFSLSITIPPPDSDVEDAVGGTPGYLDPACMRSGRISEKADVYSFGVLLLVFLTGRKALEFNQAEGYESVISYVLECDGQINAIVDPKIFEEVEENEQIQQQLHDFLNLALFCTRDRIESRPYMVDVARELVRIEEFVLPS